MRSCYGRDDLMIDAIRAGFPAPRYASLPLLRYFDARDISRHEPISRRAISRCIIFTSSDSRLARRQLDAIGLALKSGMPPYRYAYILFRACY